MRLGCVALPRSATFRNLKGQNRSKIARFGGSQAIRNQQVLGSSPSAGSTLKSSLPSSYRDWRQRVVRPAFWWANTGLTNIPFLSAGVLERHRDATAAETHLNPIAKRRTETLSHGSPVRCG